MQSHQRESARRKSRIKRLDGRQTRPSSSHRTIMPIRKKAAPQKTAKPQPIKPMAEKKESETKETKENDITKIRLVAPDFEHPPVKRSDTEQAIIDEYGTD